MSAISIVNAKKNYGAVQALNGIDLEVQKGEFFGLLGPNGAGKTTLIHSIVGLARLSNGTIRVHGHDVINDYLKARALIGFAPQDINLDRFFSIRKILMYHAGFFGIPRKKQAPIADDLLCRFNLAEKSDVSYYRLSGGMQKRLLIAKAVATNPKILILDEPTAGIDVEQRHHLWGYLRELNTNGTTIILTTHYIDEAESLCNRIGIIHEGKICELGSPKELINRFCQKKVLLEISKPLPRGALKSLSFHVEENGTLLVASGANIGIMIDSLNQIIYQDPQCHLKDVQVENGSLENVFLQVTGKRLEEGENQ